MSFGAEGNTIATMEQKGIHAVIATVHGTFFLGLTTDLFLFLN
jgi:hypothetical protein